MPAASASSGLPVTFVSTTPAVCGVRGDEVAPLSAGLCTIAAGQAGDAEYEPAASAVQSYTVAAAPSAGGTPEGEVPRAGGGPAGEVLSSLGDTTPFPGAATFRLRGAPSVTRRDGAITLSITASAGGTVRWQLTFTRTAQCPPHSSSCARRRGHFASGLQDGIRRHLRSHRAPECDGAEAPARPSPPARAGARHADDGLGDGPAHSLGDSRPGSVLALRRRSARPAAAHRTRVGQAEETYGCSFVLTSSSCALVVVMLVVSSAGISVEPDRLISCEPRARERGLRGGAHLVDRARQRSARSALDGVGGPAAGEARELRRGERQFELPGFRALEDYHFEREAHDGPRCRTGGAAAGRFLGAPLQRDRLLALFGGREFTCSGAAAAFDLFTA